MTNQFGAKSTTEEVLAGVDLAGKRILVTGVSAGLGVETARALACHGAELVGTARDLAKASGALTEAGAPGIDLVALDLASLASVRAAADALLEDGRGLDLVIANAGIMATPFSHTADGFELQFGTNHLGHFLFANRIAPLIKAGGRLIVLASAGHRFADVDLSDPNFERSPYDPFIAYGRSKTANILFAVEFDRRFRGKGIRAAAVHPGGIQTELTRFLDAGEVKGLEKPVAQSEANMPPAFEYKSIPQGAATSVWAGVVAKADEIGGRYCEDCQVTARITDGPMTASSGGVRGYALDPDRARALWALSEDMVGARFADAD